MLNYCSDNDDDDYYDDDYYCCRHISINLSCLSSYCCNTEEGIIESAKRKMVLDHIVIQKMETTGTHLFDVKNKQQVRSYVLI